VPVPYWGEWGENPMRSENLSDILDFLSADALAATPEELAAYIRWLREGIALNGVRRMALYGQIFAEQWELFLTLRPDWETRWGPATQRQAPHADELRGVSDQGARLQHLRM